MNEKILIVDDSPDIIKIIEWAIKKNGFEILKAEDGRKALKLINEEKPDLIYMDLNLPYMDGTELSKKVRKNLELKNTIIVLVSAHEDKKLKEKVVETKADGYIRKPFNIEDFKCRTILYIEKVKKNKENIN